MRLPRTRGVALSIVPALLAILFASQVDASIFRSFIYQPEALPSVLDWHDVPAPEPLTVRTDDGLAISGYRWPATVPGHSTMVFFHGNAGNRYLAAKFAAPLRRPDREVIVASYRGYGGNPGGPTEIGLYRDGAAFLRSARASRPKKMYLFGFSLGAGVALRLAADHPVDGVITLGAFSSLKDMVPRWARGLMPDRFDNLASIRSVQAPIMIMHGSADDVVPFAEASKLKSAAGGGARLVQLRNGTHQMDLAPIASFIWTTIEQLADGRDDGRAAMESSTRR